MQRAGSTQRTTHSNAARIRCITRDVQSIAHARTHAHVHARTRTHAHARTHTRARARTHTHARTRVHAHTGTDARMRAHKYTHTHAVQRRLAAILSGVPGWHVAYPLAGIGAVALFALVAERSRPRAEPLRSSSISSLFGIDGSPTGAPLPPRPDSLPSAFDVRAPLRAEARTHARTRTHEALGPPWAKSRQSKAMPCQAMPGHAMPASRRMACLDRRRLFAFSIRSVLCALLRELLRVKSARNIVRCVLLCSMRHACSLHPAGPIAAPSVSFSVRESAARRPISDKEH
jgi:hypothetical protein